MIQQSLPSRCLISQGSAALCALQVMAILALSPVWAGEVVIQAAPTVSVAQAMAAPGEVSAGEHPHEASFGTELVSAQTLQVANWIVDTEDNQGMPFIIIDKVGARVMIFDAEGHLQGAAAALLGLAHGDDSTPGIGTRKLSSIRPQERTTPAGRFVASLAKDIHGQEMLWVDYDSAISLHRVIQGTPGERRAQRMQSPIAEEHRISYGCINVPVSFYESLVSPAFRDTNGVVYILPEIRTNEEVFGASDFPESAAPDTPLPAAQPQP
jgi:hypothetical protein